MPVKFEDTKLPADKVVVDAFNHANENNKAGATAIRKQLDAQFKSVFLQLDALKETGRINEAQYGMEKARLEQQQKMIPQIIQQELDARFKLTVAPAQELQAHSENTSPEVLAATLLLDSVRDPVDFEEIAAKFGSEVAGPLKQVLHIHAHDEPATQEANLNKASSDEKRIYAAEIASDLEQVPAAAKRVQPGTALTLEAESVFKQIEQVWGNDRKQDARLVDVFNKAATALKSAFTIEINGTAPVLVKNKPSVLPPVKKPPLPGDGGF